MAEIRRWRERRGTGAEAGWSPTLYEGFFLQSDDSDFLLAKLSHGWRVIEITEPDRFQFEAMPGEEVELPRGAEWEAMAFFAADQRFQERAASRLNEILKRSGH